MRKRSQGPLLEQWRRSSQTNRKPKHIESVQTWMQLPRGNKRILPPRFRRDDVRCADSLVEYWINELSEKGQVVFDPFAGFGTTLLVAEEAGRLGYGIEYSKPKVDYVQQLLENPDHLIHGDSRKLMDYELPLIDLCFTSPPYTNQNDTENPFVDYRQKGFDYPSYLREMSNIFSQVAQKMNLSGHMVIEASNLKKMGQVTTLAWDIAREVSQIFHFEGETVICWDEYGYGYNHSYCLVFSKA
ncbi:MAG TPA: DNA methyltransferase [Anaerolineales bacterium]|nr:DNA methyltransferase [Anaerolineales bacterium]